MQLSASGGQAPFTWSLAPGSAPLPQNLTLNTNGLLSGTLTSAGTNSFIVKVTDMNFSAATRALSLAARPVLPLLSGPAVMTGGKLQMTLNGAAGQYYDIESSTNLVNWTLLLTTNLSGGTFLSLNFPATNKCVFYQAYESGIGVSQVEFRCGPAQTRPVFYVDPANGSVTIPVNAIPDSGSPGLTAQIGLNYATINGTAIGGVDYTAESGTISFSPGSTNNSIVIPIALNPTNFNATFYLQLTSPDGSEVLTVPVIIQNPRPVLAVYPASLTLVVPGNCEQFLTLSNAGPQGSVLNYTVADDGALGGYLDLNGGSSFTSGALAAGKTAQVGFQVLEQFATNWIGGTLTTTPSIYAPGAANYVKYPISVVIETETTLAQKLLGTWSGTWSGMTYFLTTNSFPISGTWSINFQQATYGDQLDAMDYFWVWGTLTWQGTSYYWTYDDASGDYVPHQFNFSQQLQLDPSVNGYISYLGCNKFQFGNWIYIDHYIDTNNSSRIYCEVAIDMDASMGTVADSNFSYGQINSDSAQIMGGGIITGSRQGP